MISEKGTLKDTSAMKLVLSVFEQGMTGVLYIKREDILKVLYFSRGKLIWAISNSDVDKLENILLAKDLVDPETIQKVKKESRVSDSIGKLLVEKGLITLEDLILTSKEQLRRIIMSIFKWRDGGFQFVTDAPPERLLSLDLDITQFVVDYIVEQMEVSEIWKDIGSLQVEFVKNPDEKKFSKYPLSDKQKELLNTFDGEKKLEAILSRYSGGHRDSLLKIIYFFLVAELLVKKEFELSDLTTIEDKWPDIFENLPDEEETIQAGVSVQGAARPVKPIKPVKPTEVTGFDLLGPLPGSAGAAEPLDFSSIDPFGKTAGTKDSKGAGDQGDIGDIGDFGDIGGIIDSIGTGDTGKTDDKGAIGDFGGTFGTADTIEEIGGLDNIDTIRDNAGTMGTGDAGGLGDAGGFDEFGDIGHIDITRENVGIIDTDDIGGGGDAGRVSDAGGLDESGDIGNIDIPGETTGTIGTDNIDGRSDIGETAPPATENEAGETDEPSKNLASITAHGSPYSYKSADKREIDDAFEEELEPVTPATRPPASREKQHRSSSFTRGKPDEKKRSRLFTVMLILVFLILVIGGTIFLVLPMLEKSEPLKDVPKAADQTGVTLKDQKTEKVEDNQGKGSEVQPGEKKPAEVKPVEEIKTTTVPGTGDQTGTGTQPLTAGKSAKAYFAEGNFITAGDVWKNELIKAGIKYSILLELDCLKESVLHTYDRIEVKEEFYILNRKSGDRSCYLVLWGKFKTYDEAAVRLKSIPGYFWQQRDKPEVVDIAKYL